jgi:hypothetical protein
MAKITTAQSAPHVDNLNHCQPLIEQMDNKRRRELLHDVIDNMVERGDAEEITYFVCQQMGGDSREVVDAYAAKTGKGVTR